MQDVFSAQGKRVLDRLASQGGSLFAFDFDGTLARIVQDRHGAGLSEPTRQALHALAVVAPTAVISGRSLEDLRPRVDGIPTHLIGNHGLEGLHASERVMQQAMDCCRAWLKTVAKAERELTRAGVVVEDKMYSLTFHYRQACSPPAAREAIFHTVSTLSPVPRLVMGKAVVNAIPSGNLHKGTAMLELMHQLQSSAALYVGDDDTDEDVFSLPDERIVSVRVGKKATTAAQWYLTRQSQIGQLLQYLTEARARAVSA
ncbi:MAG TPA: trehalose-phosphatase [Nitrospira sp.]|jgi:trehalose 6-phosphate phosphatase|nr:trehalose-phosphatase [Nitrospira sp.]MBS0162906.1 trehalose-phosphatase [Nitrospira sp.]MBX3337461.1 trehalose-phosphatase [Nitrospira sp.]MCW5781301.1 trehalose-phosphatase [Nitrospira sp.]HMZ56709.1 trehalose-phosphatase [Nitrospira sp.]